MSVENQPICQYCSQDLEVSIERRQRKRNLKKSVMDCPWSVIKNIARTSPDCVKVNAWVHFTDCLFKQLNHAKCMLFAEVEGICAALKAPKVFFE
jgi:hypothetical protein